MLMTYNKEDQKKEMDDFFEYDIEEEECWIS